MPLPPPPVAATATVAATAPVTIAAANDSGEKKSIVLKKFGPAKTGEGDNAVAVATPTAAGLDLIAASKAFYSTFTNLVSQAGLKIEDVIEFCGNADKSNFPGHKDGRIAYATANTIAGLGKINGLLNKVRGLGGGAALKAKLEEKDKKIKEMEAQLAAMAAKLGITL